MPLSSVILIIICAFMFAPLFFAEIARGKALPVGENFFLQSRTLRIFPMYATVLATWMSAFAFMGGISYFYDQGPIYMTTIGWDALFALLFYVIGRRIWYYGKVNGYTTATDFFHDIYGSRKLDVIVTVMSFVFTTLYLELQLVGGVLLIQVATEGYISWQVGGLLFFAILVIYLWAGGLRTVALADTFYMVFIIVTILASGLFLMRFAGGTEHVFEEVMKKGIEYVTLDNSKRSILWISLFIIVPVGAFMGPQMWIRNYAAKEERNFEILPLLLCLTFIICVGTFFAGNAGLVLVPEMENNDALIATMLLKYANPIFCTLIFLGITATIFSTANSQIHAMSTMYTVDIHKRYISKNLPERSIVSVAKWSVLFISAIAYMILLIIPQNLFDMGTLALGGLSQLIIPVIGALFWKNATGKGAISGLLTGELLFIALAFFSPLDNSFSGVIALLANGIVFVAASLLMGSEKETSEKVMEYRSRFIHTQSKP